MKWLNGGWDITMENKPISIFQPSLGKEELSAVEEVFNSNWIGKGPKTEEFATKLKQTGNKEIFQEVLTHVGIDQNNFMRKSAPLIGYPVDVKGKEITNQKGVEEHAVQMEMARIMMGSAFDGNMREANKILKAVY